MNNTPFLKLFCLFCFISMTAACGKPRVTSGQLLGQWRAIDKKNLPQVDAKTSERTIYFSDDFTFKADRILDSFTSSSSRDGSDEISGDGRWRISEDDGQEKIYLTFNSILSSAKYKAPYGMFLLLGGTTNDPIIYYYIGDPDNGKRFELKKK